MPTTRVIDHTSEAPPLRNGRMRAVVRRQFWWFAITAAAVLGLTAFLTQRQQAIYGASATLRLEEGSPTPSASGGLLTPLMPPSAIPTEMEVLRSRTLAEIVVDSLALHVALLEPRGRRREAILSRLVAARDATPGEYQVRRGVNSVVVTSPTGLQVTAPYDSALNSGNIVFSVAPPVPGDTGVVRFVVGSFEGAAEALRQGLRITRPQPTASIVAVGYEATDAATARDVVNGIALAYIAQRNEGERRHASATVQFLGTQAVAIGDQLQKAEVALEEYRRTHLLVDPPAQASNEVQRMAALRARGDELASERKALVDLLAHLRQPQDSTSAWTEFAASPVVIRNSAVSGIVGQLAALETERSKLAVWRTPVDPDAVALDRTIALLGRRLNTFAREQLQGVLRVTAAHDSAVARSGETLRAVPQTELEYARLRRQVDLTGELSSLLQTRLKEAQVSEAVEAANVRLVDPAILALVPLRPRRMQNYAFGLAGAIFLGLLVAVLRELAATRIQSREEVIELTTLPVLASIPRMRRSRWAGATARLIEERLVTQHAPSSPAAEAYRGLRTNLAFSNRAQKAPVKTLVITSAEPQDGKTTTAVNLSATLAEQGHRVVLVEADHRRPALHRVFRVERSPGVSEVLAGTATLESASRSVALAPHATGTLSLLTSGGTVPNPAELIGSSAMQELLATLRARYDFVLLDTPPLSVVTDAAVASALVDGVILVARLGETRRQSLQRATEELRELGVPVVGTVLTDLRPGEDRYGQQYVSYYYGDLQGDAPIRG